MRDAVQDQADRLRGELKAQRAELQRDDPGGGGKPHSEAAQRITEQLGSLRGERRRPDPARPVAAAVQQETEEIATLGPRIADLHEREDQRREQLAPKRQRVEDCRRSSARSCTASPCRGWRPRKWIAAPTCRASTAVSLKALSSGGMKTTTNVAYYLANLVIALRDREILTPSFMMLDSIRKDSGSERDDLVRAEHIYSYLRTLQASRNNPGRSRATSSSSSSTTTSQGVRVRVQRHAHRPGQSPHSANRAELTQTGQGGAGCDRHGLPIRDDPAAARGRP